MFSAIDWILKQITYYLSYGLTSLIRWILSLLGRNTSVLESEHYKGAVDFFFYDTMKIAVGLLGFGFMIAHSTFLTIATEFAAKGRSYATSLVAFFFMGAGGIGTAIGGKIVAASSYGNLFTIYGVGLLLVTISALPVKNSFKTSIQ